MARITALPDGENWSQLLANAADFPTDWSTITGLGPVKAKVSMISGGELRPMIGLLPRQIDALGLGDHLGNAVRPRGETHRRLQPHELMLRLTYGETSIAAGLFIANPDWYEYSPRRILLTEGAKWAVDFPSRAPDSLVVIERLGLKK